MLQVYVDGSYTEGEDIVYGAFIVLDENGNAIYARRCSTRMPVFVSANNVGAELLSAVDAIKYVAPVQKMHKDSLCYPYNLLKDIFDGIVGEDLYSFLYRHNQICDVVEQTLKNLTVTEEAVLKSLYINSKSISEIYKGLGLPGNDIMETLFEEKFYRRPLRKLRRPPMVRSLLSSFLHDQYCFTCQLNELKWHYIDSYFKDESTITFISTLRFLALINSSIISELVR